MKNSTAPHVQRVVGKSHVIKTKKKGEKKKVFYCSCADERELKAGL